MLSCLDVFIKSVSICVVCRKREVLARGKTSSDPDEIASIISQHTTKTEQIAYKSDILAIWLTCELEKRFLPISCIDVRLAHNALSRWINKSILRGGRGIKAGLHRSVNVFEEHRSRSRVSTTLKRCAVLRCSYKPAALVRFTWKRFQRP